MTQKEVNTASNSSPWTVDCVTWTHIHTVHIVTKRAIVGAHSICILLTGSNTSSETTTTNFHEIFDQCNENNVLRILPVLNIWLSLLLIFS